jgi:hypothetical protein
MNIPSKAEVQVWKASLHGVWVGVLIQVVLGGIRVYESGYPVFVALSLSPRGWVLGYVFGSGLCGAFAGALYAVARNAWMRSRL